MQGTWVQVFQGSGSFGEYLLGECILSEDLPVCNWEVRLSVSDGMLGLCIYAKKWELCLYVLQVCNMLQVFLSIWGM